MCQRRFEKSYPVIQRKRRGGGDKVMVDDTENIK